MFNFLKIGSFSGSESSTINKVINFALYALVLVTPLLFLPITAEFREFNKQTFLFIAVVVMLTAWVIRVLSSRSMRWMKTSIDYLLLAFLAVYLISSLVSIDRVSSFLGYYGRFTGSFVSVACLVFLFYLVVNNVRSKNGMRGLVNYLLVGMGLTLVYSFLQILGLYILPAAFTHARNFNPMGSIVALSIFAAVSLVFFQALLLTHSSSTKHKNWGLWVLSLIALAIVFLVGSFVSWIVLAVGMVVLLAFVMNSSATEGNSMSKLWQPMLILVIAVLFIAIQFLPAVVNPRRLININLVEIQLSQGTSWTMVKNSLQSGTKQAVIGSGPGTTGIVYGGIKPDNLNRSIVWSVNFDRASSEITNLSIETGLLGMILFELMCLFFLFHAAKTLMKGHESGWPYQVAFFLLWLGLYVSHFLYLFNTTAYLLFIVAAAAFYAVGHWDHDSAASDEVSMPSGRRNVVWMFASLIVLAVLLVSVFFEAVVYGGDMAYAKGLRDNNAKDYKKATDDLSRAITLNPYRDVYYLGYGLNLVARASEEASKKTPDKQLIQTLLVNLVNAGQKAVQLSPHKASNWSTLAGIYANIRAAVTGSDKLIVESLQKAIDKDPKNPGLHYQLSQAYLLTSDSDKLKKAEDELNKAISLKADLPVLYIQLARVYEQQNRLDDAKKKIDATVQAFPRNPDVWFEDGRITFNQKNYDDAEKIFKQVLKMVPNYANAHYSLALLYQQKGDKDAAIIELEETKKIVGDNKDLDEAIAKLKASTP